MITFEEANKLLDEITEFLVSCGGVYKYPTKELQTNILNCIIKDQYIVFRTKGNDIEHCILYWFINHEDIEMDFEDITDGDTLYILEHGNKGGRQSLTQMIKELRKRAGSKRGVAWNHKQEGVVYFPKQKGIMEQNTYSICSTCFKKVPARITIESTGVYLNKNCCSEERTQIEPDTEFYKWVSTLPYNNVLGSYLNIPITSKCNTSCKACYNKDVNTELSVEEIKGLAYSSPTSITTFILTGGEPTAHSKFHQIIQEIPNTGLITNGIKFAEKEFLQETIKYTTLENGNVLPWMFSLNTKDTPDYSKKIQALENIRELGLKVGIIVATIFDLNEVPEVLKEFDKLKDVAEKFKIRAAFNIGEASGNKRVYLSDLVKKALESSQESCFIGGLNNNKYLLNYQLDDKHVILVICPDKTTIDLQNIGPTGPYQYTQFGSIEDVMVALILDEGFYKGWVNGNNLRR